MRVAIEPCCKDMAENLPELVIELQGKMGFSDEDAVEKMKPVIRCFYTLAGGDKMTVKFCPFCAKPLRGWTTMCKAWGVVTPRKGREMLQNAEKDSD